jgi:dipeptidyl aminopeptidase/acylaminoacyl peptidase
VLFERARAGLFSIPENGGPETRVTTVNAQAGEIDHTHPIFLPDGRRFLYMVRYGAQDHRNAIVLGSLDSSERREVLKASSSIELSAGHLLVNRGGTLFAQPFDTGRAQLTGEARPIVEGVFSNFLMGRAAFSAAGGTLAYLTGRDVLSRNTLEWFDVSGTSLGTIGGSDTRNRVHALSPDGARVAVVREEPDGRMDIYGVDVERNVTSRLISEPGDDMFPVWSPDGRSLYFTSSRKRSLNLFRHTLGSPGPDELLFESAELKVATGVSADERLLLFTSSVGGLQRERDIWVLPLTGERKPIPVVRTQFDEEGAAFSPDGKWISYHSNDLGSWQVYVASFPAADQRVRISTTSGLGATWSRDGRTLFYFTSDNKVVAVDVTVSAGQLRPSAPRELFSAERAVENAERRLNVDHRGPRFLLTTRVTVADSPSIRVVTGWTGVEAPVTQPR